jgi:hypothetical protein
MPLSYAAVISMVAGPGKRPEEPGRHSSRAHVVDRRAVRDRPGDRGAARPRAPPGGITAAAVYFGQRDGCARPPASCAASSCCCSTLSTPWAGGLLAPETPRPTLGPPCPPAAGHRVGKGSLAGGMRDRGPALILFFAATALGRLSVQSVRDVAVAEQGAAQAGAAAAPGPAGEGPRGSPAAPGEPAYPPPETSNE